MYFTTFLYITAKLKQFTGFWRASLRPNQALQWKHDFSRLFLCEWSVELQQCGLQGVEKKTKMQQLCSRKLKKSQLLEDRHQMLHRSEHTADSEMSPHFYTHLLSWLQCLIWSETARDSVDCSAGTFTLTQWTSQLTEWHNGFLKFSFMAEEHEWVPKSYFKQDERQREIQRIEWEGCWPWEQQEQKSARVMRRGEGWASWSVTGSGSTGVCCPFARRWLGGHLCPQHCCPETHRVQICRLFASETRCGRFLQREIQLACDREAPELF